MLFFNLFFLLVVLALLFAGGFILFMLLWAAGVLVFRPRRRWWWIGGGVPTYCLLFVLSIAGLFWHASRPTTVFQHEFGFSPPASVGNIQSSVWSFADSGRAYLAFEADPGTVQQIVARGMASGSASDLPSGNAPAWWQPTIHPGVNVYEGHLRLHQFSQEWQILIHDPATRKVFWYSEGID